MDFIGLFVKERRTNDLVASFVVVFRYFVFDFFDFICLTNDAGMYTLVLAFKIYINVRILGNKTNAKNIFIVQPFFGINQKNDLTDA